MLLTDFALYVALGFVAQLVDGALGMAFGLICTSVLLATGVPPALASASVHASEMVTTGFAGASHAWHRNVDWRLVKRLAPAGVVGGVLGAYVVTELPEPPIRFFVTVYLLIMTGLILWRVLTGNSSNRSSMGVVPLGAGGGFLDAIGGGGWGPLVASTLIARGDSPRHSIGSVSVSEFFVTMAVSATFVMTLDLAAYGGLILALLIGGAAAAPFAGWLSRVLPPRVLMLIVSLVVGALGIYNLVQLLR